MEAKWTANASITIARSQSTESDLLVFPCGGIVSQGHNKLATLYLQILDQLYRKFDKSTPGLLVSTSIPFAGTLKKYNAQDFRAVRALMPMVFRRQRGEPYEFAPLGLMSCAGPEVHVLQASHGEVPPGAEEAALRSAVAL